MGASMSADYLWFVKQFGRRLRALRKEKGLSQTDLARLAGLHMMQVGKYERAEGYPAAESLLGLARALGVTVDFLLTGENEPQRDTLAFHFPLLLEKVREMDRELDRSEIQPVLEFLDAFLAKKRIKRLMTA